MKRFLLITEIVLGLSVISAYRYEHNNSYKIKAMLHNSTISSQKINKLPSIPHPKPIRIKVVPYSTKKKINYKKNAFDNCLDQLCMELN